MTTIEQLTLVSQSPASYNSEIRELAKRAASELEALQKEVDGVRNNAPKCGACAEGLFCGSTMHQHDVDCVYTERDTLRAQNRELRNQLKEASLLIEKIGTTGVERTDIIQRADKWMQALALKT